MMLTYDARTQPDRGSGLGHYSRIAQSLCIGCPPRDANDAQCTSPRALRTQALSLREALSAHRSTSTHGRRGEGADIDRSLRVGDMCTLACKRGSKILGKITMSRYFPQGVGVGKSAGGRGCSLARCTSLKFREIRKWTALFATSQPQLVKSPIGSNRRLPETRTASTPTSTSPIATSTLKARRARVAICYVLSTHRSQPINNIGHRP